MESLVKESHLVGRTLDLCKAVVEQPDFAALKGKLDAFLADELLKFKFQQVNDLGQLLQMKQGQGVELKPEEISQFETLRQEVMENPVAQGFLEAQGQLQELHQMVDRFLDKTFELGRQPEFEEIHDGSCGSCGCHG